MGPRSRHRLLLLAAGGVVAAAVAAWLIWTAVQPGPPAPPTNGTTSPDLPLPPYSETAYKNTGPDAAYIGSAACASCHPSNHQSYLLTPHSRALSDVNPADEPADGSFHHAASGRTYRVYRGDDGLRHEEVVRDERGREVARVDLPVKYLIGSGHFCRTYLTEADGFLAESPITWYTARRKWDLSPGYDAAQHFGFERPITLRCLACHAGRVEPAGAAQSFHLHEKAIGCESCHGPGSVHQTFHLGQKLTPGADDRTIVNPAKLPRPLQEAVCAGCHLGSPGSVHLRGRQVTDYRPGRPLTDYRIDYRADTPDERMTVTGHFEQLRQSKCYTSSDLSCLTCHDPHAKQKPKDAAAHHRQQCLTCHQPASCKAPADGRAKTADNCVACHMPKGDTDIPHLAFTHHRIGKHTRPPAAKASTVPPTLVPAADDSWLPAADRERNLGLAYLEAREKPSFERFADAYRTRARGHLEAAHTAGLRDAETLAGLAECYADRDRERAVSYAKAAVAAPDATAEVRTRARGVLAYALVEEQQPVAAIPAFEELIRGRRLANDWRLLGWCYLQAGEREKAEASTGKALAIRPYNPRTHLTAAAVYERLGDRKRAAEHRDVARWLAEKRQD